MNRGTSLVGGGGRNAKRAKNALKALCGRGLPIRAFGLELRARLRGVLEFDAYCLNTCDIETGIVTSSVGDGLSPEQAHALFELEAAGTDLNLLRDLWRGPTRACSLWQTTGGRPEQSQRMREIFLPLGFTDELRAALAVADTCYGYLHLFRGCDRPPFSAADVAEVAAQSPFIARAIQNAPSGQRPSALRRKRRTRVLPAVILLDAEDRVLEQSPGADGVLGAADALRSLPGLSHVLRDVASRSRSGADAHATFVREDAAPLSVAAVQVGQRTAIVIDAASAEQTLTLGLSVFALTPREREVARLVAAGCSNEAIAAELGIKLHTVKDHVRSTLSKTRCASRARLAACLLGV